MLEIFKKDTLEVKNEALWIVYNVLSSSQTELIRGLIDSGIISDICKMGEEIYKNFKLTSTSKPNQEL